MKYHLYTNSRKTWDALLKAITKAQSSIYIEMYIFLEDTFESHDFITKLIAKAKAGVEIVIVADALGSFTLKKETIELLRTAGVEVLFFSDFWRRTHRKIVIIDNRIAFIGGVNIEKKTINWDDIQIKLEGRTTVLAILRSFAHIYKMCGGKKNSILNHYKEGMLKKAKSLVLQNLPGHGDYALKSYYQDRLLKAQKSIKIITPYFIPPRWLLALLDDAVRRGVKVDIIFPADTDIKILNKINYSSAAAATRLGINLYAREVMNHGKVLIIDEAEALIGSQNFDTLSFEQNFEIGVFFRQKNLVEDLVKIFDDWQKKSKNFETLNIKLNWLDRLKIAILRLFLFIL